MPIKIIPMRISFILSILFIFISCGSQERINNPEEFKQKIAENNQAKNVIFLIGDGMGLGQISAGIYNNGNEYSLERFPVVGLHKPYSSDKLITDSAAAATAFACGVKTYNGAIGVNQDTIPVKTILEEAVDKNLKAGLVATSTIVHATPASFIAHNKYRKNYEEIAEDFLKTQADIFIGGGKKYFDRRESDNRDLINELKKSGYLVNDYFNSSIEKMRPTPGKKMAFFTADDDPIPAMQGRDYLLPASKLSIEHLDQNNENGFFLMIEGSQIDWGGHANNAEYVLEELKDFDKMVHYVLNWAQENGETLVIVTADHETGGLAIQNDSKMDSLNIAFTSTHHTGTLVPVFAYGPASKNFGGIYENTAIYQKIRAAFGWE